MSGSRATRALALLTLAIASSAMPTPSNPTPPLFTSDFFIKPEPILKPGNSSNGVEGSSVAVGARMHAPLFWGAPAAVAAAACDARYYLFFFGGADGR